MDIFLIFLFYLVCRAMPWASAKGDAVRTTLAQTQTLHFLFLEHANCKRKYLRSQVSYLTKLHTLPFHTLACLIEKEWQWDVNYRECYAGSCFNLNSKHGSASYLLSGILKFLILAASLRTSISTKWRIVESEHVPLKMVYNLVSIKSFIHLFVVIKIYRVSLSLGIK